MTKFLRGNKGFTIIELMVVMVILAVLATIVTGSVLGTKSKSEDTSVKADAYNVQTAAQRFNNDSYKSNDWPEFEVDTNKVAIVKVAAGIRVKYDTILMYDTDGSTALTVTTTIVPNEAVGTADGTNKTFSVSHTPVVGESQTIKVGVTEMVEGVDYTFVDATGVITFLGTAPATGAVITADYQYYTGEPYTTLDWDAATKVRDSSGALADRKLVPDFLSHKPANVGWTQGTTAVYAWVMLKGSSLDSTETRSVEIFKLNADSDKYIKIYPE